MIPLLGVSGYVLAGGASSRMGRDKASLQLGGRLLIEHAVGKLRRICTEVSILSSRPDLQKFAPLLPDLHPNCGPLGGIEAALEQSRSAWNLFVPVDVPFLPSSFLADWARSVVEESAGDARVAMFTMGGTPQPLLCLLHRDIAPFVRAAVETSRLKVFPVLESAAREIALRRNAAFAQTFVNTIWEHGAADLQSRMGDDACLTGAQHAGRHLWFANLNTPEEFAEAAQYSDLMET